MSKQDSGADFVSMLETLRDRADAGTLPVIRWALLSNTTQESFRPFLAEMCLSAGYRADVWIGGYDTALQDAADAACAGADVVVVALRIHLLAPALVDRVASRSPDEIAADASRALDYVTSVVETVRRQTTGIILVHSFETPAYPDLGVLDYRRADGQVNTIRRLNLDLVERLSRDGNTFVVDLDAVRARVGTTFLDPRTWHIGRMPFSRQAMRAIAGEYMKVVRAARGRNRKCIVVDADGTLWGGIVGDDGVEGVAIGRTFPGSAFYDFQQALLSLRDRGVILALCSKNEPEAVAAVFGRRSADMPLRLEHFAAVRVNWEDKAQNIRAIAAELNIGLDSIVFVDDNPFETSLVKELIPEVETILLPPDPVEYRDVLQGCGWFDALTFSDEDRRRSDMYAAERQRREQASSALSVADYLRGLDIEAIVERVADRDVARVAQLTQKTNQFNLTTRRYTENDIRQFASDADHDVFLLRLRDRLGDSGIVGVAILHADAMQSVIDSFLMSCRVLGRGAEDVLLGACVRAAARRGSRSVIGQFTPTARNQRVADFYSSRGFVAEGGGRFSRPLDVAADAYPPHFKSVVVDGERVS